MSGCIYRYSLWGSCQGTYFQSTKTASVVYVSVLASSVVERGFESRSDQTKDYKIGICCFSAKNASLRRKSKYWLARDVSEWSNTSTRGLLFQWASTMKIQLGVLVWNKADIIIISLKMNLFSPWYSWKIAELALSNNRSSHSTDQSSMSLLDLWVSKSSQKRQLRAELSVWSICNCLPYDCTVKDPWWVTWP